jgi:hypothetical protein
LEILSSADNSIERYERRKCICLLGRRNPTLAGCSLRMARKRVCPS